MALDDSFSSRLPGLPRTQSVPLFLWVRRESFKGLCIFRGADCDSGEIQEVSIDDQRQGSSLMRFSLWPGNCRVSIGSAIRLR